MRLSGLHSRLRSAEQQVRLAAEREEDARTQAGQATHDAQHRFAAPAPPPRPAAPHFEAHYFDQRVSHDAAVPSNETFKQRYWFDASHYRPGGPVFLLDAGETDGADRLPFLSQGILRILSEATGGVGIVFEHRYYGESFPTPDLSTDNLRFLTTLQSLYDGVHFAKNVQIPGLDLTAPNTPWVYYGGSYAGAKAAFARKLFPDIFAGGIASSAVTTAIIDYWQYYEPIRASAPTTCIDRLVGHTQLIDTVLALNSTLLTSSLKTYFGLPNITSDADFVNALALPLGSWQARNWDPKVGSKRFDLFCQYLTNETLPSASFDVAVPSFLSSAAPSLLPKDPRSTLTSFSHYAEYVKAHIAVLCPPDVAQDDCFGTDEYGGDGLDEASWKSWSYQFCTEWGYFIGAPPSADTPSLVSRLLTPEYTGKICHKAFPPGKLNRVPDLPDVDAINQYGSFNLLYPRLAFIDGSEDPWIYATPHSPSAPNPQREDTDDEPFKLIPGGVHHWDENGLPSGQLEPPAIAHVHADEVRFVRKWLAEWRAERDAATEAQGKGWWQRERGRWE
ncbi:hypothetical protein Rhopal_005978-T1 [Rhodotorula paludigena]|uniref:Uncharacterized protein n=1 Tax=Rhodotorula paludigena TaxID=86838 RepID=A0AAV5GSP2_9BASI|nr:hypothetical protein Rhopal_005978-T1 [Rhodotorula paludigena]